MKILSIVSSGYEQGGVEATVASYNSIFKDQGHDSRILSSNARPDLPHYSDYEFEAVPTRGFQKHLNKVFNVDARRVCKKILQDFQPDVVVLHTMQQITPSVLFLLRDYPTIQCVHGPEAFTPSLLAWHIDRTVFKTEDYDLSNLNFSGRLKYMFLRYPNNFVYKLGFRNVNCFLAFSTYTRDLLYHDGFCNNVAYMPMGVKLYKKSLKNKQTIDFPIIGYAGRLEKFKGVLDIIEAMPLVIAKYPKARLRLAGEGSYGRKLRSRARQLGLSESIEFVGYVPQTEMQEFYKHISLLIMPSTWPETFGKVAVEAMSTGTVVVATDVGGVRDWLEDSKNGFLIEPSRPEQIAKRVIDIVSDSKLRDAMSHKARETAENFSMDKFADNLFEVMQETIRLA